MADIGTYNITIRRGRTWQEQWRRAGVATVAGWQSQIDIRDRGGNRVLRLESGSGIVLSGDGTRLIADITMTAAQTAALPLDQLEYDWRLVLPNGSVEYLLAGSITIVQSITQAV